MKKIRFGYLRNASEKKKGFSLNKFFENNLVAIILGIVGTIFSFEYNRSALEVSKTDNIAKIIVEVSKADFKGIESKNTKFRTLILSLTAFGKDSIPTLISFLSYDNNYIREAAISALEIIGSSSKRLVRKFILNEYIAARYKGEAILLLNRLENENLKKVLKKISIKMEIEDDLKGIPQKDYKKLPNVDYNHPFTSKETVIALAKIGANLNGLYLVGIKIEGEKKRINFDNINFSGSYLQNSTLKKINFRKSNFQNTHLEGSILKELNFDEADVTKSFFPNIGEFKRGVSIINAIGSQTVNEWINKK